MFVLTALDKDALALRDYDTALARVLHEQAAKTLAQYCVLVTSGEDGLDRLRNEIEGLPVPIRKRWQMALELLRRRTRIAPCPDAYDTPSVQSYADSLRGHVDLAVVHPTIAELWGLQPGETSLFVDGSVEIVRFDLLPAARRVKEVLTIAARDVSAGDSREEVWRARLHRPVEFSNLITIVDKFAAEAIIRSSYSGLRWFLKKIDGCGKHRIHIFASTSEDYTASDVLDAFQRLRADLRAGGVTDLKLTLTPRRAWRPVHARHVRFDQSLTLLIEPGFDVFREPASPVTFPMPMVDLDGALARERELDRSKHLTQVLA